MIHYFSQKHNLLEKYKITLLCIHVGNWTWNYTHCMSGNQLQLAQLDVQCMWKHCHCNGIVDSFVEKVLLSFYCYG